MTRLPIERLLLVAALSTFFLSALPTLAGADGPIAKKQDPAKKKKDPATEKAKAHNAIAKKLFDLGLFAKAAKEYQLAYKAKPIPAFLFNLAQCYKRMGKAEQLERAIFFFRSYLKTTSFRPCARASSARFAESRSRSLICASPSRSTKGGGFWAAIGAVMAATVTTVVVLQPEDQKLVQGSVPPGTYGGI
jgi:tetratricopeptide (TPR) repeat protein